MVFKLSIIRERRIRRGSFLRNNENKTRAVFAYNYAISVIPRADEWVFNLCRSYLPIRMHRYNRPMEMFKTPVEIVVSRSTTGPTIVFLTTKPPETYAFNNDTARARKRRKVSITKTFN